MVVVLVSLDVDDVLELEAVVADVALADDTALLPLLSSVPVEVTPLCCAAAWNSAPRNCWSAAASASADVDEVDDVLDAESVELEDESELVVLADALAVLSVVKPSDESAEAMAAASGLTLFESDEASEAMGMPDVWLLVVCPFAW